MFTCRRLTFLSVMAALWLGSLSAPHLLAATENVACPAYLNQEVQLLRSEKSINLCDALAGKPVLVVNTASHCGFTPQFKGLESVHQAYKDKGLVVIGFPSNDFRQEAKTQQETAKICYVNYGVTFTMTAPVKVKGNQANPLFAALSERSQQPAWNFNKYLLSADRSQVQHFGSRVKPQDPEFQRAIESLL